MRRQALTLRAEFWPSLPGTSTDGNSPPKGFKDRTWRVYESGFKLIFLQGADPRGLWQPCEQTIYLYLFLQTLLENSFILGNLPCITYHYSLSAVSHAFHALSLFLLHGMLLWTPQPQLHLHNNFFSFFFTNMLAQRCDHNF